jgi:hypothetical protein
VTIQQSQDGASWADLRKYTSANDYNATETGDFDDYTYIRAVVATTAGACTADLTALPYIHEGFVRITAVADATHASAAVIKPLGSTAATADWNYSSWSGRHGYPACATFFQDRLVFAGSPHQPNVIWMSRTGDYANFAVEKSSGQVLDDSAIQAAAISRELWMKAIVIRRSCGHVSKTSGMPGQKGISGATP